VTQTPTRVYIGSGSRDQDTYQYDANTGRMTQYRFTVNGTTMTGNLTWNQNGTLQTLGITDGFNSGDTQTCTYAYDGLIRLCTVDCKNGSNVSIWTQVFSPVTPSGDNFGNLSKQGSNGGTSFLPTYNTATNRYTDPCHVYSSISMRPVRYQSGRGSRSTMVFYGDLVANPLCSRQPTFSQFCFS
jgi:hypothetical protein